MASGVEWEVDAQAQISEALDAWRPFVALLIALNSMLKAARLPLLLRWAIVVQYARAYMTKVGADRE